MLELNKKSNPQGLKVTHDAQWLDRRNMYILIFNLSLHVRDCKVAWRYEMDRCPFVLQGRDEGYTRKGRA